MNEVTRTRASALEIKQKLWKGHSGKGPQMPEEKFGEILFYWNNYNSCYMHFLMRTGAQPSSCHTQPLYHRGSCTTRC